VLVIRILKSAPPRTGNNATAVSSIGDKAKMAAQSKTAAAMINGRMLKAAAASTAVARRMNIQFDWVMDADLKPKMSPNKKITPAIGHPDWFSLFNVSLLFIPLLIVTGAMRYVIIKLTFYNRSGFS